MNSTAFRGSKLDYLDQGRPRGRASTSRALAENWPSGGRAPAGWTGLGPLGHGPAVGREGFPLASMGAVDPGRADNTVEYKKYS